MFEMWQEIVKYGKLCMDYGLISGSFGNISVRKGNKVYITSKGTMLNDITQADIVEVDINAETQKVDRASTELPTHVEIYKVTEAEAIIHTHSPYAVVMSIKKSRKNENEIVPVDHEGSYLLGKIPLVSGKFATKHLAITLAKALKSSPVAIVVGHGVFAIGHDLKEAFIWASMAEHSSRVLYLLEIGDVKGWNL